MREKPKRRFYIRKTRAGWTVQRLYYGKRPKYRTTGLVGTYKTLESALHWLKRRLDKEAGLSDGWRKVRRF